MKTKLKRRTALLAIIIISFICVCVALTSDKKTVFGSYFGIKASASYTIEYKTNDGSFVYSPIATYDGSQDIELPTANNVARTSYIFGGWYDNEELIGEPIDKIAAGETGDKTFYAKWTQSGLYDLKISESQIVNISDGKVNGNPRDASWGGKFLESGGYGDHTILTDSMLHGKYFMIKYSGVDVYPFALYLYNSDGTGVVKEAGDELNSNSKIGLEQNPHLKEHEYKNYENAPIFGQEAADQAKDYLKENYGIEGFVALGNVQLYNN